MGLDSTYYPPAKTKREDLEEFLSLLGYEKIRSPRFLEKLKASSYQYFSKKPYESEQGVGFTVLIDDGRIVAHGRNTVWRNKADNDYHNNTLKQLRKRFGGHFVTDYGKNRYFSYSGINRKDD